MCILLTPFSSFVQKLIKILFKGELRLLSTLGFLRHQNETKREKVQLYLDMCVSKWSDKVEDWIPSHCVGTGPRFLLPKCRFCSWRPSPQNHLLSFHRQLHFLLSIWRLCFLQGLDLSSVYLCAKHELSMLIRPHPKGIWSVPFSITLNISGEQGHWTLCHQTAVFCGKCHGGMLDIQEKKKSFSRKHWYLCPLTCMCKVFLHLVLSICAIVVQYASKRYVES